MRLVKGSLEPGQEVWKFGAVAGVAGAGTGGGMPDRPGVVEMEGIAGYQSAVLAPDVTDSLESHPN